MTNLPGGSSATPITPEILSGFQQSFQSNPRNIQAMNAVCTTPIDKVALSRRSAARTTHTFSEHLTEGKATSQGGSGRCWLFAALNTLRVLVMEKLSLGDDFELSQSHLMFWDKLEKSNYFLESILATLDEPTDGRLIAHLVQSPIQDGGQWHMVVNLIKKYGVLPKTAMPEAQSSTATGPMNFHITQFLRSCACELRAAHAEGKTADELRARKSEMLEAVHRMLVIHLGEPPESFEWQWRDKDKGFHRDGVMTPREFYDRYIEVDLDELVCLIHCPQKSKRMNTLYTIKFLGNVIGGEPIKYLNVDIEVMKAAAVAQIKAGKAVWFGCDVGKHLDRDLGAMDMDMFDFDLVYGAGSKMDKGERLDYGDSQMTHAMVFTGVDLDDEGKPRKWRVENSWGDKIGENGFCLMTDKWFDEYMYEVVVHKSHVPEELLPILETEPTPLEPWDPMGALA